MQDPVYPVEFVYQGISRYALWISGRGGEKDVFLKINGAIPSAATIEEIELIAKNESKKFEIDGLYTYNIEIVSDLINEVTIEKPVSPGNCSEILNFFEMVVDLRRTADMSDDFYIDDLLNKLFNGIDIPALQRDLISPVFSDDEIERLKNALAYGKAMILKHFY